MKRMKWGMGPLAVLLLLVFTCQAFAADNVVFIFDASNSMNKPFDGSVTRFETAVSAMADLLVALPSDINAGLLLYGWRVSRVNEVESCKDLELVFPIQPLSADLRIQMIDTLGAITAQGMTPLADALVRAAAALDGLQGENAIVLLSDGEGNCGGNHSVAAQYLATLTPPIKLHVVGLDLEPDARETLQMMVDVTGGTYRGVREAANLADALYLAAVGGTPSEAAQTPTVVSRDVSGVPQEYSRFEITNIIWGTEGNDVLYGTDQNDLIYGLGGNDFIIAYGGNDVVLGGPGNDVIQGLDGNDLLLGDAGDDILFGGAGDDQLCGGQGRDSLEGEAGNDCLDGGPEDDQLLGGPGSDQLVQSAGDDVLLEGTITQTPCPGCMGLPSCGAVQPAPMSACPVAQPSCAAPTPAAPVAQPACQPTCPTPVTLVSQSACPAPSGGCASPVTVKSIDEGTQLQLHGFVTDEDCDVVSIEWTVARGHLDDPRSLNPIFYAPMTDKCEGEDVLVRLDAQDSCGDTGEDCFLIHVNNVNRPPYADAGPDISVDEGATVQLTCSGTDPDGDPVSYYWCVQSGGGTFSNPTALHPMYTAPMTSRCEGESVVLTLTVTDSCGLSTTDSMVVQVKNVNRAPYADAGPDISVDEGATVQL
ncbi:VWA domain-containing protein, partial [Candidatus Bipolaricaulota bacterium]